VLSPPSFADFVSGCDTDAALQNSRNRFPGHGKYLPTFRKYILVHRSHFPALVKIISIHPKVLFDYREDILNTSSRFAKPLPRLMTENKKVNE